MQVSNPASANSTHNNIMEQLITIDTDGSITALDFKKKGIDLRQFGKVKTERITLIEFSESLQSWMIRWYKHNGELTWNAELLRTADIRLDEYSAQHALKGLRAAKCFIYFKDYDDAVSCEIAVIQSLREKGLLPV